jgi:hypothetical protein
LISMSLNQHCGSSEGLANFCRTACCHLKKTWHNLQLRRVPNQATFANKRTKDQKINTDKLRLHACLILNAVKQGAVSSSLRHCAIMNPQQYWEGFDSERHQLPVYAHEDDNKGCRNSYQKQATKLV